MYVQGRKECKIEYGLKGCALEQVREWRKLISGSTSEDGDVQPSHAAKQLKVKERPITPRKLRKADAPAKI